MTNEQVREAFGHSASICRSLSEIYTQWCVRGPSLEASSAIAAMSQEHAGYSKMLNRLAEGSTSETCPLAGLRQSPATWPELIAVAGTTELALGAAVAEWRATVEGTATRNLTKMAQELVYHARFFRGWFQEFDGETSQAGVLFDQARRCAEHEVWSWLSTAAIRAVTSVGGSAARDLPTSAKTSSELEVCPRCGAQDVRMLSAFGPSLMTSQFRCAACNNFFESVRWPAESSMEPTAAGAEG